MLTDHKELSFEELKTFIAGLGKESYRARQIMKRLFAERVTCPLALSLNASTQKVRSYLMPISNRYPVQSLLETCRCLPPRERITFEYILIRGINDSEGAAERLTKIVKGVRCKANLIPFNECPGIAFQRPTN